MTEQELRRTAVIIPPTGRAVLCVWAAVPGLFAAPFVFWQSVAAGAGFCLLWGFLIYCLWARACSFAAVLGERTVTVYSGVALPVRQVLPRRAVTSVRLLRTPLLRLGGVSLLSPSLIILLSSLYKALFRARNSKNNDAAIRLHPSAYG